ncbi:MAG: hypothetical protein CMI14_08855 [Oleispira sp.]|nr:hypothetical protein [Oleispira sp.]
MSKVSGVEACYEAFDRLKQGKPTLEKFIGITSDKITASVVSQEAGFDSGYLKKKRPSHQGIITLIEKYRCESKSTTLSKAEVIRREKQKTVKYKEKLELTQNLLEQALAREILLVSKLRDLESLLQKSSLSSKGGQHT